jgi:uncharacterized protein (TIGR02413 family)
MVPCGFFMPSTGVMASCGFFVPFYDHRNVFRPVVFLCLPQECSCGFFLRFSKLFLNMRKEEGCMTFTFIFFTITIHKRQLSKADIDHKLNVQKMTDEMIDRQCALYRPL